MGLGAMKIVRQSELYLDAAVLQQNSTQPGLYATQGLILGWSHLKPAVGLNVHRGSLPTGDIVQLQDTSC